MTDTSKELPELLPCPFCGEDAGDTYYQLGWFISCKHCSASTEVTNAKARAVEAWNRRTPASQAQRVPLAPAKYDEILRGLGVRMSRKPLADDISLLRAIERAHGIQEQST